MLCYHPAIVDGFNNMSKKLACACLVALAFSVSACGLKGGLVMPPGPASEPVLGHPKPPAAKPATLPAAGEKTGS